VLNKSLLGTADGMESSDQKFVEILRDSLNEAQTTVRGYDTKAQIVGVGYIFALGIVAQINELLPARDNVQLAFLLVAWVVVVFPILHFGHVLYPTRKSAPKLNDDIDAKVQRILYVEPERFMAVDELRASTTRCEPLQEYCFELLKTAELRELKRKRFLRGLISAAVAFAMLFLSQIARI